MAKGTRRRRECNECGERFTTYEVRADALAMIEVLEKLGATAALGALSTLNQPDELEVPDAYEIADAVGSELDTRLTEIEDKVDAVAEQTIEALRAAVEEQQQALEARFDVLELEAGDE